MNRRKAKFNTFFNALFFLTGLTFGVILIWPGVLNNKNRNCFLNIIRDGSDGKVTIGTILSIDPNSLVKINNAKNIYIKTLMIGDYCFRK
tara:strand:- start:56 stop:325 length:270 start_codon:yes stop_codon:yes gene_type:complete